MIAAQDEEMTIASRTLYNKNQDEVARLWAQAYEDFLWEERIRNKRAEEAEKDLARKEKELQFKDKELNRMRDLLIANGIDPDA
ncbi:MAG: hypothetical protein IKQ40_06890 [Lachnospiraceae bacterium]|nr:hypothetical protein [Lachnospiraceae bacterium]